MTSLNRSFSNQFAVGVLSTTTTSLGSTNVLTSLQAIDFGFVAGLMKLVVDSGGPAYLQLNGQTASTADYRLSSGDTLTDWYDVGAGFSGISITATSTGLSMRVGAWG